MMSDIEMKLVRVQRKRTKGWRMPPNTIYVGRPTEYGNPYQIGRDGSAAECVEKYRRDWLDTLRSARMHPRHPPMPFGKPVYLGPLKGKNLACFCRLDQPCHADILLEIANSY